MLIQKRWFQEIKDGNTAIATSDSGYSNDILSFLWIQHFNLQTRDKKKGKYRLLLLDGYESHLSLEFITYCEQNKIVVLRLPPHSTHFLQPLDVVIFQQWKHWHSEVVDYSIRHGVGQFNKQSFFAYLEQIRKKTFTKKSIYSSFRRCGYIPFMPRVVLEEIQVNEEELQAQENPQRELPEKSINSDLNEVWSSPSTHIKLKQQASATLDLLRSSATPPDTPTRRQNRENVKKFTQHILTTDLLHDRLISYAWESYIAQKSQGSRNQRSREAVQKGGVVYACDVDREIANLGLNPQVFEQDEPEPIDRKVTRLIFFTIVGPQLVLRTKEQAKEYDKEATNRLRKFEARVKRRAGKAKENEDKPAVGSVI